MFNKNKKINQVTIISVLSSLSVILFFIGGVPLFLTFPYLKIDFSDIPALVGAMLISPSAGIIIELLKNSVHLLQTHTMGIGELISLIIGSTMILSFCIPYRLLIKKQKVKTAIFLSYIICVLSALFVALIINGMLYPLFFSAVLSQNLVKGVIASYLLAVVLVNIVKVSLTVWGSVLMVKFLKGKVVDD